MTATVKETWSQHAEVLERVLGLEIPPIAIRFETELRDGAEMFGRPAPEPAADGRTGAVAAGCVFWMHATGRTFTTAPQDHANCSVGSFTHGLIGPDEVLAGGDVETLLKVGWMTPEAAAAIPRVPDRPAGITYGPLTSLSEDPDVIFLRVNAQQLMELTDALPELLIEGKPQCHIIALAYGGRPAASIGCAVSRVRTGMAPTEMTVALPAARIEEILERVETAEDILDTVSQYATEDAHRFDT
ncbi:MAG: DUF169 domain-containing protein [Acidimicrobiia bacterium]|nr:DUF169 domain-containing protein [Acidimicrobiia bacterium]